MNPNEYTNLADVERRHWFYSGKRQIVRHWIQRLRPLHASDLLADCGAGTGLFASEMTESCRVLAIDDFEESLAIARRNLGPERVRKGSCTQLPLDNESVDVLTALDVIEHVQEDRAAVREFARVVRPGGLVIITVPALMMLWSDWDVALHHFRRYTRRTLLDVIPTESFEIACCQYVNVAAFPLVLAVRKFRALKERLGVKTHSRSEDAIPPAPINSFLRWSFVSLACQNVIRFPAGVGLLAVLRRK